jgi:hypothetical protein
LASEIGENKRFITAGKEGYFCNTIAAYRTMVDKIAFMSDADYNRLSQNALAGRQSYNMEHYCRVLLDIFPINKEPLLFKL